MNKKLFILGLGLSLFLTGCEGDMVKEDLPQGDSTILVSKTKKDLNKIHSPDWLVAIHTPDWLKATFEDCDNFPNYEGTSSLNVRAKDSFDFGKEVMLENLGVGGELNICGRLGVAKQTVIRNGGELTVSGMMSVGNEESPKDLTINYGGHLNVRGYLVITGDLNLNNGATVHFITDHQNPDFKNKLIILGEVKEADYSYITGEYELSHDLHDLEGDHDH